ncbi:antitoxin [Corynebacterium sp. H130]|uniref:antitoxin n=1 Tax=Corynebacterium sp. H130 TaxID=3133444 RepID=UPI0030B76992
MGIFDKAKEAAANNPEKADMVVDKAGNAIDAKTGNQHEQHVDRAQDMAKDHLKGQ